MLYNKISHFNEKSSKALKPVQVYEHGLGGCTRTLDICVYFCVAYTHFSQSYY